LGSGPAPGGDCPDPAGAGVGLVDEAMLESSLVRGGGGTRGLRSGARRFPRSRSRRPDPFDASGDEPSGDEPSGATKSASPDSASVTAPSTIGSVVALMVGLGGGGGGGLGSGPIRASASSAVSVSGTAKLVSGRATRRGSSSFIQENCPPPTQRQICCVSCPGALRRRPHCGQTQVRLTSSVCLTFGPFMRRTHSLPSTMVAQPIFGMY
jgi:hypothetical protein